MNTHAPEPVILASPNCPSHETASPTSGNSLVATPQDYLVVTSQLWLDGFAVGQGLIRQFVAMPLGAGFSAEEQLTGQAAHGGMQLVAYPMKRERFEELEAQRQADRQRKVYDSYLPGFGDVMGEEGPTEMALSPGGLMRQQIERDPYGLDAWDQSAVRAVSFTWSTARPTRRSPVRRPLIPR